MRRVTLYPSETVADAARKTIAFGIESVTLNRDAAASGDAEPLHQLRVAPRRMRASNGLFSRGVSPGPVKNYRPAIPWPARQARRLPARHRATPPRNEIAAKI